MGHNEHSDPDSLDPKMRELAQMCSIIFSEYIIEQRSLKGNAFDEI
jgi:hypothetical protein